MEKYKQAALNIAFLTLILTGGLTAGYVSAENYQKNRKEVNQEEVVLNYFEDNDYDAWRKKIATKTPINKIVTKEDFDQFIEARNLTRSGKYEEAIEITQKLENKLRIGLLDMV